MALKEHWRSGLGFVLAAAGSAVGLGNLWGFAYRASQGGGGAFLLLYVLIVLLVCLPVLVAEMVLGRSTAQSPLLAPVAAAGEAWRPMGVQGRRRRRIRQHPPAAPRPRLLSVGGTSVAVVIVVVAATTATAVRRDARS